MLSLLCSESGPPRKSHFQDTFRLGSPKTTLGFANLGEKLNEVIKSHFQLVRSSNENTGKNETKVKGREGKTQERPQGTMNRAWPQTVKQTERTSPTMVTVHCTYVQNCPQNDVNLNQTPFQ